MYAQQAVRGGGRWQAKQDRRCIPIAQSPVHVPRFFARQVRNEAERDSPGMAVRCWARPVMLRLREG